MKECKNNQTNPSAKCRKSMGRKEKWWMNIIRILGLGVYEITSLID
jgi:hypothetical protein